MAIERIGLALSPLTENAPHDLYIDATGNLALARDEVAVGQHARQRLMSFESEWFLDTTAGLPWLTDVMGRRENRPLAEALIKNEILDTDGVVGLSGLSAKMDPVTRNLKVERFSVSTEYGRDIEL